MSGGVEALGNLVSLRMHGGGWKSQVAVKEKIGGSGWGVIG